MANCNEYTPTSCIKYQGKDLSFSSTLANKRDFESILLKIDEKLKNLNDEVYYTIDPKGLVTEASTLGEYIQLLVNEIVALKKPKQVEQIPTIDVSSLGGKVKATYDEALILIMQQLALIESKLNNTTNIVYIPNV